MSRTLYLEFETQGYNNPRYDTFFSPSNTKQRHLFWHKIQQQRAS